MTLRDIYYYFVALAMMAGVRIADLLNLDIDQKPNGRISISSDLQIVSLSQRKNNVLVIFGWKAILPMSL